MDEQERIARTRECLRQYRPMRAAADNLKAEARELTARLSDVPAAIAKYGDDPGGGTTELNAIEQSVDKRIRLEERIKQIREELRERERKLRRIDTALDGLPYQLRGLIIAHYIEGRSWLELAELSNYSESWTRKRGKRALQYVATSIFYGECQA